MYFNINFIASLHQTGHQEAMFLKDTNLIDAVLIIFFNPG